MKLSKYTLTYDDYPQDNYVLFYNTLTKGVSVLKAKDYSKIGTPEEDTIPSKNLQLMKQEGFIVNDDDDERSRLNMFFTELKCRYSSYATMILTSYACNMQCRYCFENKIKDNTNTMTPETARDVVKWLQRELQQYQPKYTGVAFSGGEPLYNKEAVNIIVTEMKEYCDNAGIVFSFGFLTNGTIEVSDEEAELYNRCGIDFFQYTIDGSEEVHNDRRLFPGGSYRKIMHNIVKNNERMDMNTVVRVNVDTDNANAIDEMLEDLKQLKLKRLTFDYAIRFETPCDVFACNAAVLAKKDAPKALLECLRRTREKGLSHSRRFCSDSPCLAIVPRQFIIDPVGDLYKCAAFAGEKDYVVGSIYEEDMNERYIDMVGIDAWHNCKDCKYVPLCGGGCLFLNRNALGNYKKQECQKHLFGNLVMETLISALDRDAIKAQLATQCMEG